MNVGPFTPETYSLGLFILFIFIDSFLRMVVRLILLILGIMIGTLMSLAMLSLISLLVISVNLASDCYMIDKSFHHFSKFGCILNVHLPIANYTDSIECHWFVCPYSLKHLNQFSQYGPGFFPSRFIKVTPEFYELEDVDLLNADKETRTFICHNHTDICRILMRNVIVLLAINCSNYFLNL